MIKCKTKKENRRCANTPGLRIAGYMIFPSIVPGKFNSTIKQ